MVKGIKRQVGVLLVCTGLFHNIVGLLIYGEYLSLMVTDGVWNSVPEGDWERTTAFWFMLFGFMLMLVGYSVNWLLKRKNMDPPAAFGWMLFAICLGGAVMMPISGFWLGLPQAWVLIRR